MPTRCTSSRKSHLCVGWLLNSPIEEWTRSDYLYRGDVLPTRPRSVRGAGSAVQLASVRARPARNPLHCEHAVGASQVRHSPTASSVIRQRPRRFPSRCRPQREGYPACGKRGWYEADSAWAPCSGVSDLFTDYERQSRDRTIRDWYPVLGRRFMPTLLSGESMEGSPRLRTGPCHRRIVVAAITSDH